VSEHIVPVKIYLVIFATLLGLTWLTVAVSSVSLGPLSVGGTQVPLNLLVALAIAIAKATLVVLYFMHVRYSAPLIWIVIAAGVLWLGILLLLAIADYASRGWLGFGGT
jgi:cytochrome c oxidase subunit 4